MPQRRSVVQPVRVLTRMTAARVPPTARADVAANRDVVVASAE